MVIDNNHQTARITCFIFILVANIIEKQGFCDCAEEFSKVQNRIVNNGNIRISVFFHDFNSDLYMLSFCKQVINNVVNHFSSFLSVTVSFNTSLLLSRTHACARVWSSGMNAGKCSRLSRNYKGEFCDFQEKDFRIPDTHLAGQMLYDATNVRPMNSSIMPGKGVKNADLVLYITLSNTSCKETELLAYAKHCQFDPYEIDDILYHRPIAGLVSICPHFLKDQFQLNNSQKLESVVKHELLHVLGFSSKLFDKFINCSWNDEEIKCKRAEGIVTVDETGVGRIILPSLSKFLGHKLNCNSALREGIPLAFKNGKVSSHWHPAYLPNALMTPVVDNLYDKKLHVFTLALLESSGWYKVNWTLVGSPLSGDLCKNLSVCPESQSPYVCKYENQITCDEYNLNRAICIKDSSAYPCSTMRPKILHADESGFSTYKKLEGHLCLLVQTDGISRITYMPFQCLPSENKIQIFISGSYYLCPVGQEINITGKGETYISITCPAKYNICHNTNVLGSHNGNTLNAGSVLTFFTIVFYCTIMLFLR